eukprot:TRINITY_DN937_c1_g3_i2.p1 TRINITY_DN937_c1_g3~~TRINITY_DN937_c1_g3_i2.p1  ORF type:complete len:547 (+),score=215.46 TRINITY_DN937_c1_g3_i2:219-1859(+)
MSTTRDTQRRTVDSAPLSRRQVSPARPAVRSAGRSRSPDALKARSMTLRVGELLEGNKVLEEDLKRVRVQRDQFQEKYRQKKKQVEEMKTEFEKAALKLGEAKGKLIEQGERMKELEHQLGRALERAEVSERALEALKPETKSIRDDRDALDHKVKELEAANAHLSQEIEMYRRDVEKESQEEHVPISMLRDVELKLETTRTELAKEKEISMELKDQRSEMEEMHRATRMGLKDAMDGEKRALETLRLVQNDLERQMLSTEETQEALERVEEEKSELEAQLEKSMLHNRELLEKSNDLIHENETLSAAVVDKDREIKDMTWKLEEWHVLQKEKLESQIGKESALKEVEKWKGKCEDLEQELEDLANERDSLQDQLASVKAQFSGSENSMDLPTDVLERVEKLLALHQTMDEELADMLISYTALSPKKRKNVRLRCEFFPEGEEEVMAEGVYDDGVDSDDENDGDTDDEKEDSSSPIPSPGDDDDDDDESDYEKTPTRREDSVDDSELVESAPLKEDGESASKPAIHAGFSCIHQEHTFLEDDDSDD